MLSLRNNISYYKNVDTNHEKLLFILLACLPLFGMAKDKKTTLTRNIWLELLQWRMER